jgi:hypothetical protein
MLRASTVPLHSYGRVACHHCQPASAAARAATTTTSGSLRAIGAARGVARAIRAVAGPVCVVTNRSIGRVDSETLGASSPAPVQWDSQSPGPFCVWRGGGARCRPFAVCCILHFSAWPAWPAPHGDECRKEPESMPECQALRGSVDTGGHSFLIKPRLLLVKVGKPRLLWLGSGGRRRLDDKSESLS